VNRRRDQRDHEETDEIEDPRPDGLGEQIRPTGVVDHEQNPVADREQSGHPHHQLEPVPDRRHVLRDECRDRLELAPEQQGHDREQGPDGVGDQRSDEPGHPRRRLILCRVHRKREQRDPDPHQGHQIQRCPHLDTDDWVPSKINFCNLN